MDEIKNEVIEETAGDEVETALQNATEEKEAVAPDNNVISESKDIVEKTFTQEQVNDIVRERLSRQQSKLYTKYSVKDEQGLDEAFGKASKYDELNAQYAAMQQENSGLKERNAFIINKIKPERYDDVRAYFKGKEIEFSEEALQNELATHPEWIEDNKVANTTTIQTLGVDTSAKKGETEDEKISRLFHI